MRVCVVGLGVVGLPTGALFAAAGHDVYGIDTSEDRRSLAIEAAAFCAVTDWSDPPGDVDAFIVCVPTPKTDPLAAICSVSSEIARVIKPGALVVIESTVPPGTVSECVVPIIESATGLKAGADFFVAHVPERALPGPSMEAELRDAPRIVGGYTRSCTEKAMSLYSTAVQCSTIHGVDSVTAEAVKLMENAFRDSQIAVTNAMYRIVTDLGIDGMLAIELANHHRRVHYLTPGIGVGGHCIPIDPLFLCYRSSDVLSCEFIRMAREVNDDMPSWFASRIIDIIGDPEESGPLGVLGCTYKPDVPDDRNSPAISVVGILVSMGYDVSVYDPVMGVGTKESLEYCSVIIELVPHKCFESEFASEGPSPRGRALFIGLAAQKNSGQAWSEKGWTVMRV